jgi:hypothetical protein
MELPVELIFLLAYVIVGAAWVLVGRRRLAEKRRAAQSKPPL